VNKRPLIGITMGDPSGIGPEIIITALSDDNIFRSCRPVVFGDPGALSDYLKYSEGISINEITAPEIASGNPGRIDVFCLSRLQREDRIPGKPTVDGAKAMVGYILTAVDKALDGTISAMVTCPINKELMNRAGYHFEGHTQLISSRTKTKDYVMMLAGDKLRVTLVTIHCALRDVPAALNEDKIMKTISMTSDSLKNDFGLKDPRIAVAALNPHAGESGMFGTEEEEIIKPAMKKAADAGINVTGPFPADTLYPKAASGQFDAVVNMYHDQGLIPLKLLHFSDGVNVTLGLPIIRTSVDHGTAYDISGKGMADPSSLKAAIKMAVNIAGNRAKSVEQ
jgi:4-hydroxythreonine-4-phosphate dehydrogenase